MPYAHPSASEFRLTSASFSVKTSQGAKQILNDISLSARNGELLALMGPSGAGKTTLLELMTLELKAGEVSGSVTLNGEPMTFELFRKHAVYVEQYDLHWGFLTCREIMRFAAQLFVPGDSAQQFQRADRMLETLGLGECAETKAGNQLIKGMSGGQRKRLTLGVALLKSPTILFLDEPTSGLDAASTASVTGYLQKIAKKSNIIIIATIHQPSTNVFLSFHRVMFLANGREAYSGPTSAVAGYCQQIGYPLPPMINPADHFLELVNSAFVGREQVDRIVAVAPNSLRAPIEGLSPLHRTLRYSKTLPAGQPEAPLDPPASGGFELDAPSTELSALTFYTLQAWTLLRRQALLSLRDPSLYTGRLAIFLVSNSFFAVIYWKAREPTSTFADPRVRLLTWLVCAPSVFSVVRAYAANEEFKLMRMEIKNGLSRGGSFFLASALLQLPYMLALAIFSLVVPWFIGNYPWVQFGQVLLIMTAMLWTFENIARFLGVLFQGAILGMLVDLGIWFLCFLFMGVFLSEHFIAWPFRALVYMLPLSWSIHSIVYSGISPTPFLNVTTNIMVSGDAVLDTFSVLMSSVDSVESTYKDLAFIILIGVVAQLLYMAVASRQIRGSVRSVAPKQPYDSVPGNAECEGLGDSDSGSSSEEKPPKSWCAWRLGL